MHMSPEILNCRDISFSYKLNQQVLKKLSLSIKTGEFVSLVGCNGSGKSTLLKLLSRRITPDSGTISVNGRNIQGYTGKKYACMVSYLEQSPRETEHILEEYVLLGALPRFTSHRFWFSAKEKALVTELLKDVGIYSLRKKSLREVSGGERQLAQICRALMSSPKVLLLDEPVSHLDIHHVEMVIGLLKKIQLKQKMTIVTTLHDLNLAYSCSDRIFILDEIMGRLIESGNSDPDIKLLSGVFHTDFEQFERFNKNGKVIVPKWNFL